MKKLVMPILLLAILLTAPGCVGKAEPKATPTPSTELEPKVSPTPSAEAEPKASPMPPAEATQTAEQKTETPVSVVELEIAKSYRDFYLDISQNDTIGVNLNSQQQETLVAQFEASGHTVLGSGDEQSMRNPQALEDFFAKINAGSDAQVSIYKICLDGGFLGHSLTSREGKKTLTLTRLAWAKGEPVITYTKQYDITALSFENGRLTYEYFMPDNPEGTNHDGHIDTTKSFKVY